MGPEFDESWRTAGPRLLAVVTAAQRSAAVLGAASVPRILADLSIDAPPDGAVQTSALVGIASDGRDLGSLLYGAVAQAKVATQTSPVDQALQAGGRWLSRAVQTQVSDAGRAAAGVAIVSRRQVSGYVRMVNPPCCSRCAVLAGRFYRYSAGFLRHPRCDCTHIPATEDVAGDLRTDPAALLREGQITGLSKADAQALDDGADFGRVVNAHRGVYVAGGRKFTTAAAGKTPRLMPEQIYRDATDRADAIRLLHRHGYLR